MARAISRPSPFPDVLVDSAPHNSSLHPAAAGVGLLSKIVAYSSGGGPLRLPGATFSVVILVDAKPRGKRMLSQPPRYDPEFDKGGP
jgi:hypothetical protein